MTRFLADHDVEGQATMLWGVLAAGGWLDLLELQLLTFTDVGLPFDATDQQVWRFAQANRLVLLTNNRNMEDETSLERALRDENRASSLPVLTFSNVRRLTVKTYREACAVRIVEVALDLENQLGRGRIYIP